MSTRTRLAVSTRLSADVRSDDANGGYITVGRPQDLPVGTAMCKYGSTTKTDACTEPGDSGGANVGFGTAWTVEWYGPRFNVQVM